KKKIFKYEIEDLKIKSKLVIAFSVIIVLSAAMFFLGEIKGGRANTNFNQLIDFHLKRLTNAGSIAEKIQIITKAEKEIIIITEKEALRRREKKAREEIVKVNVLIAQLEAHSNTDKKSIQAFKIKWNDYLVHFNQIVHLAVDVNTSASKVQSTKISFTASDSSSLEASLYINEIIKKNESDIQHLKSASNSFYNRMKIIQLSLIALTILFSIGVAYKIIKSFSDSLNLAINAIKEVTAGNFSVYIKRVPLDEIGVLIDQIKFMIFHLRGSVNLAKKVAEGDLTVNLDNNQNGELDTALSTMIIRLREVVKGIIVGADGVASSSLQLSTSSQLVSQGASDQASSSEEVASSMEEMVSIIHQNTENSRETEKIALKASEDLSETSASVNKTVSSMKAIAEKISIVSEIARQTNMLALNAAIEAARAGEYGRGFAVVASEVRKLAEHSQIAANEINELSNSSVIIAEKSGKLLEQLVPNIQKTSKLIQEISVSSIEQNYGAEQINTAIQQLNLVTQQNATTSEELATSAEELSMKAEQLSETIAFFKIDNTLLKDKPSGKSSSSGATKTKPSKVVAKDKGKEIRLDMGTADSLDDEYQKY
ncbi:MAG: methyl-accepting chemotaxis protein, partial [Candidatus Caenarcaniphilales bacterium]|nr:methyl-accepting chemotaxis protein [Candidatus Caenarcaniphilales bacterium]